MFSQNLVMNSDFEDVIIQNGDLSIYLDSFYARSWFQPTDCSVDIYMNSKLTKKENINLDAHLPFNTNVLSGSYCIGFFLLDFMGQMEHITGTLSEELVAGQKYTVSFYFRMHPTKTPFVPKGMGYKFSRDSIIFKGITELDDKDKGKAAPNYGNLFKNHKVYADYEIEKYILDTNWVQYTSVYSAKGGEKYITLGRFADRNDEKLMKEFQHNRRNLWKDKGIKYIKSDKSSVFKRFFDSKVLDLQLFNYYYLDKVEVIPLKDSSEYGKIEKNEALKRDENLQEIFDPYICVDLDPSTSVPSEVVLNIDKGFVGDMSLELGIKLKPYEKYVLEYDTDKSLVIVNTNIGDNYSFYKYNFKYPAKRLRKKPVKFFIAKTDEAEVLLIKKSAKKIECINENSFTGILMEINKP